MPDADDIHELLENWGRWCRATRGIGECDSLEHNWKSPQEWYEPPPPRMPVTAADSASALAVNRAWLGMPYPYKPVLSDWYVLRKDPRRTCGRLKLRLAAHGEYLAKARLMCANRLTAATEGA